MDVELTQLSFCLVLLLFSWSFGLLVTDFFTASSRCHVAVFSFVGWRIIFVVSHASLDP
ncbi:MAG: hypothetical protein BYD32DRAFT_418337 [Podila humilis]|nr:MAG: hypothetical protein BYD32DRAFT_418337 [Podila humilis]